MKALCAFAFKKRRYGLALLNAEYNTDFVQTLALLGHYDLWVKRGVVSLMGAKLHPSSKLHRVYAPSTHSLPVIKCVSGIDGEAEVEITSCNSGIARLRELSPLYQRIWTGENTAADKLTLKGVGKDTKRTFSVV
jgi:polynucleotide 5'-hydroxyl-kinase GRC3/NOL9